MKTPREQLEAFLEVSDWALALLILRHPDCYRTGKHGIFYGLFREVTNENWNETARSWYGGQHWYPVRSPEVEVQGAYTIEALIEAALSLGFIDQAVRCARAWEEAKK